MSRSARARRALALGLAFFVLFFAAGALDVRRLRPEDLPRRSARDAALGLGACSRSTASRKTSAIRLARGRRLRARGVVRGAARRRDGRLQADRGVLRAVRVVRALPAGSAFIPLLILWAGIGEAQKLAVIFIGSFFQLVLMVALGVGGTRRDLVEAAYTLGASDCGIVKRVLIPARRRRSPRPCASCSAGPGPT